MNQLYKKRSIMLFFLFSIGYIIIALHLFLIQIQKSSFLKMMGTNQYHTTVSQIPLRAPILDRNGTYLALNKELISAAIRPNKLKEPTQIEFFLQEQFPAAYNRLKNAPAKSFMYIKRALSEDELASIHAAGLSDIILLREKGRFYSAPSASPVIGRTDSDNIGIFGIELVCNDQLTGKPTMVQLEKDGRSHYHYFKKEMVQAGSIGAPVQLTIDSDLQFLVAEELSASMTQLCAKEGAALIVDPTSGELLAMVNIPFFDPNNTHELNFYETKNRIITDSYELGSVMKVFVALAALEEQVVSLNEKIDCKNSTTTCIEGRPISTVTPHGVLSFMDVVARSNNIGIAQIAKRLDTKLYDHLKKIGFGKKTGIPFPGESSGFINPPERWSKQSIISLSYGYEIQSTLLQLACAFSMIAQNGRFVTPQLFINYEPPPQVQLYSNETIEVVKAILLRTTEIGTGRFAAIPGYTIMCKTGTTNLLVDGKYQTDKNAFTCAGIVEKGEYKRVIVVFIKEVTSNKPLFAQQVASPLFQRIARTMLVHDRIV